MGDTTEPDNFIKLFIESMKKLDALNQYDYDNDSDNNTKFYNTVKSDLAKIKTQIDEILKLLTDLHNTIVSSSDELSSNVTIIVQLRKEIAILKQQLLERSVDNNGINPETNTIKSEIEDRTKQITQLLQDNAKYTQLIKESTVIMNKSIEILQKLQKNTNAADQTDINNIIKQITDSVQNINDKITKKNFVNNNSNDVISEFNNPLKIFGPKPKPNETPNETPKETPRLDFGKLFGKRNNPLDIKNTTSSNRTTFDKESSKKLMDTLDGGTRRKRKSKKQKRKTKKPKRKIQKKKRKTHRKH